MEHAPDLSYPCADIKTPCDRARDEFGIVVADDHLAYVEAIALALRHKRTGDHVWGAENFSELLATVDQAKAVILDWQFGDSDGLQVTEALLQRPAPPHIVVVSAHYSAAFDRMARRAGACAALPKTAGIADISSAVERCRNDPGHQRFADEGPDADEQLTRRQVEVLWLLSSGVDTAEIASRLYLSLATVRTYIRDARVRLGARSQLEAIAKARRAGLIPAETPPPSLGRS